MSLNETLLRADARRMNEARAEGLRLASTLARARAVELLAIGDDPAAEALEGLADDLDRAARLATHDHHWHWLTPHTAHCCACSASINEPDPNPPTETP